MSKPELVYNSDRAMVYHGDCRAVLPEINGVDFCITSPPYGIMRDYEKGISKPDEFRGVISLIYPALTEGGVLVWNVADQTIDGSETGTSFRQALHMKRVGFNLHDTMIYIKESVAFPESARYFNAFEYMFVASKGKPKTFNPISDRRNKTAGSRVDSSTERQADGTIKPRPATERKTLAYGWRYNWWTIRNASYDGGADHPARMPSAMARDHIITWCAAGGTVLDPFAGSGTSGLAALRLNCNCILIEKERKYIDIIIKRIKDEEEVGRLF